MPASRLSPPSSPHQGVEADGLPVPRRYWSMLAIALGITMAVLDASIANVALPTIAHELGASPASATWVLNAYQLATVVTLLPLAALGERYGYRRIYLYGLVVFTAGSLALRLVAQSGRRWSSSRVVQGIGASGIMSMNGALVRYTYPQATLGRGVGLNALVVSFAAAIGPTVASGILSVGLWEWLFAVNVPLGLANIALASKALPDSPLADRALDWLEARRSTRCCSAFSSSAPTASPTAGRATRSPRRRSPWRWWPACGLCRRERPRAAAADPARPLQGPGLHPVGRNLDLLVHGLHAGLRVAAVLL